MSLPTHDDRITDTAAILGRPGVDALTADSDLIARSPTTGGELGRGPLTHDRRGQSRGSRRAGGLPQLADRAGTGARPV